MGNGSVGITAKNRIHTLSKGDIIFHKPMEFHKIWSIDGTSPQVLVCSFDLDGSSSHMLNGIYHLTGTTKSIMDSILNHLSSEIPDNKKDYINYFDFLDKNEMLQQIIFNYLELLFLHLSRCESSEQKLDYDGNLNLYTKIVEILEEHIYEKITIPEIAEKCNVSAATAKNCFSEYAGCGVHKYFLNIKMRAAIEMLKSGMNVNEVSDKLQFTNPNYFSYVFKRETGTCASEYKK